MINPFNLQSLNSILLPLLRKAGECESLIIRICSLLRANVLSASSLYSLCSSIEQIQSNQISSRGMRFLVCSAFLTLNKMIGSIYSFSIRKIWNELHGWAMKNNEFQPTEQLEIISV